MTRTDDEEKGDSERPNFGPQRTKKSKRTYLAECSSSNRNWISYTSSEERRAHLSIRWYRAQIWSQRNSPVLVLLLLLLRSHTSRRRYLPGFVFFVHVSFFVCRHHWYSSISDWSIYAQKGGNDGRVQISLSALLLFLRHCCIWIHQMIRLLLV